MIPPKYCVARKRPIRSEKAMPQTNIKLKVLTRTVIKKFILHCEGQVRRLMFRVVIIRGLGNKTDSYNVSGVLIREKGFGERRRSRFCKEISQGNCSGEPE